MVERETVIRFLSAPRYEPSEAARLVGLSTGRVRRLLYGYEYPTRDVTSRVVKPLLSGGQWVIEPVMRELLEEVHFGRDPDFALRWWPLGQDGRVLIDPLIGFGAPAIRGIRTDVLYDLFLAERRRRKRVADLMQVDPREIDAAVEFEERRRAA